MVAALAAPSQAVTVRKAKLSASTRAAPPNTRVRLEGRGFPPRAGVVLRFAGKRVGRLRARPSGRFRIYFRVPKRPAGAYRLEARASKRGISRRRVARLRFWITEGISFSARVYHVVDGDTIKVRRLTGNRRRYTVQLIGIDTPEHRPLECGARSATRSMVRLGFYRRKGRRVIVTLDRSQGRRDGDGRLLAYITRLSGRGNFAAAQLRAGWGRVLVDESPFRLLPAFDRDQERARASVRGIWGWRHCTYTNPVFGEPMFGERAADPMTLRVGEGNYYAYATGTNFPILRSPDLVHWTRAGTALATRPSWLVPTGDSHPWAPSVLRSGRPCPGAGAGPCYFLYYTGLSGQHTPLTHCVGVAFSPLPGGPFTDRGPLPAENGGLDSSGRPPGCGDDAGYSHIDPAPFVDADGRTYLYLTTDRRCTTESPGQACTLLPTISVIPLAPDLTHASGSRKALFGGTAGTWEQQGTGPPVVENPWVERRPDGRYYLFYSGGSYLAGYGMGYATASTPTGDAGPTPFVKSASNPILKEANGVLGPGGGSIIRGPHGKDWLVYHARATDYTQPRTLRLDSVVWGSRGGVSITGPTSSPRFPVP